MGKVVPVDLVDKEAVEEGSTFGKILVADYMDEINEQDIQAWSNLVQALIPSSSTSSVYGGNHNLIVLYESSHAKSVRTTDLSKDGILAALTTNLEAHNQIQEIVQDKNFDSIGLVCSNDYNLFVSYAFILLYCRISCSSKPRLELNGNKTMLFLLHCIAGWMSMVNLNLLSLLVSVLPSLVGKQKWPMGKSPFYIPKFVIFLH